MIIILSLFLFSYGFPWPNADHQSLEVYIVLSEPVYRERCHPCRLHFINWYRPPGLVAVCTQARLWLHLNGYFQESEPLQSKMNKPNISKQYQLMDLVSFSPWVTSTHHSGCFSSVSYSWIVFEGILIIDYHHYMIYLLRKFVWKNHSKFCLLIVQNCVLKL